jgi:hypothetical protein
MNGNLEQYFEGGENWLKYSSLFGHNWTNSELQRRTRSGFPIAVSLVFMEVFD